jgi:hypothetical protein
VHELVSLDGRNEAQTRGNIAKVVPAEYYFIHSKPKERIEPDQDLYNRLGERSL